MSDLTGTDELDQLLGTGGSLVLGFAATACGPCLQQRPIWEALPTTVRLVDVDALPEVRARFGVEALPTTVVVIDGEVRETLRGLRTTRQLLEALGLPEAVA